MYMMWIYYYKYIVVNMNNNEIINEKIPQIYFKIHTR